LFSTDEAANDARCVSGFVNKAHGFEQVIVAEPTGCEAVLAHRGICSVSMRFKGEAGHASDPAALEASAVHQAIRWGQRALDFVEAQRDECFGGLSGLRFNIGRIEGGIKANVIAPSVELRFGFRPLPSMGVDALHAQLRGFVDDAYLGYYGETFRGPPLPAGDVADAEEQRIKAAGLADLLGLPIGAAVDFWTEAALFSAAGLTALVYGPGHIEQAHTADEWVALEELVSAATTYRRLLG
jgi:acetylornithine deacetylase